MATVPVNVDEKVLIHTPKTLIQATNGGWGMGLGLSFSMWQKVGKAHAHVRFAFAAAPHWISLTTFEDS